MMVATLKAMGKAHMKWNVPMAKSIRAKSVIVIMLMVEFGYWVLALAERRNAFLEAKINMQAIPIGNPTAFPMSLVPSRSFVLMYLIKALTISGIVICVESAITLEIPPASQNLL
ncbi:hypothetical protein WICPIJ_009643 [Wickerhamomyces pijperi]|uniref:Uncharacterized protein n=1 Tax=Wickerhamomyces pijperi TaxID=599730 RepID=A0A9P8PLA8_WICPI|nr:hypothetical protein WICPIJ_009643 [Wickerhamomyces pijperi]